MREFRDVFGQYVSDVIENIDEHRRESPHISWKSLWREVRTFSPQKMDGEVKCLVELSDGRVPGTSTEEDIADAQAHQEMLLECARWTFMRSLISNTSDPVDDIPAISLGDFISRVLAALADHNSIRDETYLEETSATRQLILEQCLTTALRQTIPRSVYKALVSARLRSYKEEFASLSSRQGSMASSRGTLPVVSARHRFAPNMMSSRAQVSKLRSMTRSQTGMPPPSSTKVATVKEAAEDATDRSEEPEQVLSTGVESQPLDEDVRRIDLGSPRSQRPTMIASQQDDAGNEDS